MAGPVPKPLEERFWAKVDRPSDCWVWTGARNEYGYGRVLGTPTIATILPAIAVKGKPTSHRGVLVHTARLDPDRVREIRRLHAAGAKTTELGPMYGVTHQAIRKVVTRHSWKHVA